MVVSKNMAERSDTEKPDKPFAVQRLVSDLKMLAAYENAAEWQEQGVMTESFNAFSWDDSNVLKALPQYLKSSGEQRHRVDMAFNALQPRPVDATDPKQSMMELWLKARLHSYDSQSQFNFNPLLRNS
eukprot:Selendium_serpulae@DN6462_c0_g2_i3.p1